MAAHFLECSPAIAPCGDGLRWWREEASEKGDISGGTVSVVLA